MMSILHHRRGAAEPGSSAGMADLVDVALRLARDGQGHLERGDSA
jgi:hypothetical protein